MVEFKIIIISANSLSKDVINREVIRTFFVQQVASFLNWQSNDTFFSWGGGGEGRIKIKKIEGKAISSSKLLIILRDFFRTKTSIFMSNNACSHQISDAIQYCILCSLYEIRIEISIRCV